MEEENKGKKEKELIKVSLKTAIIIIILVLIIFGVFVYFLNNNKNEGIKRVNESGNNEENNSYSLNNNDNGYNYYATYELSNDSLGIFNKLGLSWVEVDTYDDYLVYIEQISELYSIDSKIYKNIDEGFFEEGKIVIIEYSANVQDCLDIDISGAYSEYTVTPELDVYYLEANTEESLLKSKLYIRTSTKDMIFKEPSISVTHEMEENNNSNSSNGIDPNEASLDVYFYKPIIYLYPEEETDVTVTLGKEENLTCTYPKYNSQTGWKVTAEPDGTLIDSNGRTYYSLYWEGKDNKTLDMSNGFVVKGEDTSKFLEEKLAILGLTEREAEEFIVYWLPKLEENKYNFIRFETIDEIESNMPLEVSPTPDTVIRIMMDWKALDKYIEVPEQELTTPQRTGFTVVEWGGSKIK